MYLNKFIFGNAVGKLNSRLDNVEIEIQIQRIGMQNRKRSWKRGRESWKHKKAQYIYHEFQKNKYQRKRKGGEEKMFSKEQSLRIF